MKYLIVMSLLLPNIAAAGSITFAWGASETATGYRLYYDENSRLDPKHDAAAVTAALVAKYCRPGKTTVIEAEDMESTGGRAAADGWTLLSNGSFTKNVIFKSDKADFKMSARGDFAGNAWPIVNVKINDMLITSVEIDSAEWKDFEFTADITPGTHPLDIAFINDFYDPPADRNFILDKVTIKDGPLLECKRSFEEYCDQNDPLCDFDWAPYDNVIDVGKVFEYTIELPDKTTRYFAVSAYNDKSESKFSQELKYPIKPAIVINFRTINSE